MHDPWDNTCNFEVAAMHILHDKIVVPLLYIYKMIVFWAQNTGIGACKCDVSFVWYRLMIQEEKHREEV